MFNASWALPIGFQEHDALATPDVLTGSCRLARGAAETLLQEAEADGSTGKQPLEAPLLRHRLRDGSYPWRLWDPATIAAHYDEAAGCAACHLIPMHGSVHLSYFYGTVQPVLVTRDIWKGRCFLVGHWLQGLDY